MSIIQLFKYQPGKDWPVEVNHKIDMMRQKNATDTSFIARNKTARFKKRLHVRRTKFPLDLQWLYR